MNDLGYDPVSIEEIALPCFNFISIWEPTGDRGFNYGDIKSLAFPNRI